MSAGSIRNLEGLLSRETLHLTSDLREYMLSISLREHPVLRRLRAETGNHPNANFQIAPEQGQLMSFLIKLIRAQRVIEIGVFTGYSSIVTALALPEDGKLVACDIDIEHTTVARRYWKEAGVSHKIDLRLGRAVDTLDSMIADGEGETYDFGFIDADKENDEAYYERLLRLIRPGGIIVVDNVLWNGKVVDSRVNDPDTLAIRRFNEKILGDSRVNLCVVPIGDGLTIVSKMR